MWYIFGDILILFGEIHGVNTRWLHWVMLHFLIALLTKTSQQLLWKKNTCSIYGVYRKSLISSFCMFILYCFKKYRFAVLGLLQTFSEFFFKYKITFFLIPNFSLSYKYILYIIIYLFSFNMKMDIHKLFNFLKQ